MRIRFQHEWDRTTNEARNVPWAEYTLLEAQDEALTVNFHRTPLDISMMVQKARESNMPHADWWCKGWES
jgi:hypothetical protein